MDAKRQPSIGSDNRRLLSLLPSSAIVFSNSATLWLRLRIWSTMIFSSIATTGRLLGRPPTSQTTLACVGALRGPHTGLNSPWGKRGLIAPGSAVWGQFPHRPNGHDSSPLRSHRTRAAMPDCRNVLFGSGRSGFPEPVAAEIHQGTVVFNRFVRRSPN